MFFFFKFNSHVSSLLRTAVKYFKASQPFHCVSSQHAQRTSGIHVSVSGFWSTARLQKSNLINPSRKSELARSIGANDTMLHSPTGIPAMFTGPFYLSLLSKKGTQNPARSVAKVVLGRSGILFGIFCFRSNPLQMLCIMFAGARRLALSCGPNVNDLALGVWP